MELYWQGGAPSVSQITTVTPASVTTADVYSLFINGILIASYTAPGTTSVALACAGLVSSWQASTSPYASGIVATTDNTKVYLTGNPGVPFTVTKTNTGTGTITLATPTSSSGPNDWSVAANWSTGAVPSNSDDVFISNNSIPIFWGLNQSGVTLSSLNIDLSYMGLIGLNYAVFQQTALQQNNTVQEYRPVKLAIGATNVNIGGYYGVGQTSGPNRINLDLGTVASTVVVSNTSTTIYDSGRNPVRIKCNNSSTNVFVNKGWVSIAGDIPGESSTLSSFNNAGGTCLITVNTTLTTLNASAGTTTISCGMTTLNVSGSASVTTLGSGAITTANVYGGNAILNSIGTITTLNPQGGSIDFSQSIQARTITNQIVTENATIKYCPDNVAFSGGIASGKVITINS